MDGKFHCSPAKKIDFFDKGVRPQGLHQIFLEHQVAW
jgi:hypothetical protein